MKVGSVGNVGDSDTVVVVVSSVVVVVVVVGSVVVVVRRVVVVTGLVVVVVVVGGRSRLGRDVVVVVVVTTVLGAVDGTMVSLRTRVSEAGASSDEANISNSSTMRTAARTKSNQTNHRLCGGWPGGRLGIERTMAQPFRVPSVGWHRRDTPAPSRRCGTAPAPAPW